MATSLAPTSPLQLALRMGAAVIGGYGFAWGLTAASMALLFAAGMEFHDAEFLASALGVLVFLLAFLWAFVARRISIVWAVLIGGGGLLAGLGSLVQAWLT